MIIEFIGTPGAGKTTLMREAVRFLEGRGFRPLTVVEAARPCAGRTALGKTVLRLTPPSLHRALLWQVFYFFSLLHRIGFCFRHLALVRRVLASQLRRPSTADVRGRRVLHWFFHLAGAYSFLKSHARPNEVLLLDEGFLHRVVQTHASDSEVPQPSQVFAYVDRLPRPDLAISVSTPHSVCEQRVYRRGLWKHFQHKSRGQVSQFLVNASAVVSLAVTRARHNGWSVTEVKNGESSLPASVASLRTNLAAFLGAAEPLRKAHPPQPLVPSPAPSDSWILCLPRPSRLCAFFHSRWRPLDIPGVTIREILRRYAIEQTGPARNLPMSRRTRNVVVPTSAGEKVLKLYRPKWHAQTVLYAHSILEHLAARNFAALHFLRTSEGQSFASLGGRNYALFDFVSGAVYSTSFLPRSHRLRLEGIAGRTLARFHRALDGFLPAGSHHLGFASFTADRHCDLGWHIRTVNDLEKRSSSVNRPEDRVHLDWLLDLSGTVLDELRTLDRLLRRASLPRVVIHGDFGLHNLVFSSQGEATLLDFESARLEWRLSDLVGTLSRYRDRRGIYDLDHMRCFLEGYQAVSPLSTQECDLLPSVWRFRKLQSVLQYWGAYFEAGRDLGKLVASRSAMDQADWGLNNSEKLLALTYSSSAPDSLDFGNWDKSRVGSLA